MGRLFGNRLRGQEVLDKAARIGIEKLLNPLVARRFENESRVMKLAYAIDDFVIVVSRSIGMLLPRQGENHSCVISSRGGKLIGLLAGADFESCPLAPEIDACGGFDDIRNVGTSDTRGNLEKIEFPIRMRLQKFSVGHAAHQAKALDEIAIDFLQCPRFIGVARKRTRRENTSLMRGF